LTELWYLSSSRLSKTLNFFSQRENVMIPVTFANLANGDAKPQDINVVIFEKEHANTPAK